MGEPKTVIKALINTWILGHGVGPGMPKRFQFDNGGEFNNPEMLELAEKYGLTLTPATTAAFSPFSNGLCEKNHGVVDLMMEKMMAEDPSLKEEEALDYALNAKNCETNNKGFSAYQIVYGANPNIPGIENSTPSSIETEFESEEVKQHILRT